MDLLEFITTSHEEYISRKQVIEAAKPAHTWIKEWRHVNSDPKQSPEMTKKGKGKQLKSPQTHPPAVLVDLPDSAVNSKGVTAAVHQFLEVSTGHSTMISKFHVLTTMADCRSHGPDEPPLWLLP
jgi:hypothetical protein